MPRLAVRHIGGAIQLGLPASTATGTTVANAALSPGSGSASIAFWAKFPGYATGVNAAITYGTSYTTDGFLIAVGAGNILRIYTKSVSTSLSVPDGVLLDIWARYAVVFNATGNTITVYRNGIQLATASAKWTGAFNASDVLAIGRNAAGVQSTGAAMAQVDYAVGTAWGLSDIQADYFDGKTLPGLTQRWPLDDGGATTTAREIVSGTLNLTLTSTAFSVDSPMLIRGSVRNFIAQSNRGDLTPWGAVRSTCIQYVGSLPTGYTDASVMTDDANNNSHVVRQNHTLSSAGTFILSAVMKKIAGNDWAILGVQGFGSYACFNLFTGATGTTSGIARLPSIVDLGNGWYRCATVFTTNDFGNSRGVGFASADGVINYVGGSNQIAFCGVQIEQALPGQTTPSVYVATDSAPLSVYGSRKVLINRSLA